MRSTSAVTLTAVRRSTLGNAVTDGVLDLIRTERLAPGEQLPPVNTLADRFGVSGPTMREVLRGLQTTRTIELRHGLGVYVGSGYSRVLLANPNSPRLTPRQVLGLVDARAVIEPTLAGMAARHRTAAHLRQLRAAIEAVEQLKPHEPSPRNFHRELAAAAGNDILREIVDSLLTAHRTEQIEIRRVYADRARDLRQHREILAAITDRDASRATEAMVRHLRDIRAVVARASRRA